MQLRTPPPRRIRKLPTTGLERVPPELETGACLGSSAWLACLAFAGARRSCKAGPTTKPISDAGHPKIVVSRRLWQRNQIRLQFERGVGNQDPLRKTLVPRRNDQYAVAPRRHREGNGCSS